MRLLITPDGKLLNLDLISNFEFTNFHVVANINERSYNLFKFGNESSAKSWILNDLVKLIIKNETVLDLRKVVPNS